MALQIKNIMTIYRVKYRGLGFLFDILSFFAFIAILATSALHIFYRQPWLYIVYVSVAFLILKSISKSILAVKVSIDTSSMHDPTSDVELTVQNARSRPATAPRPIHEPTLQIAERVDIPVLDEVIAEPEPIQLTDKEAIKLEQQRRIQLQKDKHEQRRQQERKRFEEQELERQHLKEEKRLLDEKQRQEKKRRKEQQHLEKQNKIEEQKRQQQEIEHQDKARRLERSENQQQAKQSITFNCDFVESLDKEALPDNYADVLTINSSALTLSKPNVMGELSVFETVNKSQIRKISYEELRNTEGKKFRLFSWLAAGVITGLLICLTLVVLLYNKTGKFPGEAWVITTMLPIMALSTFGGLFTGILIPHNKTRIFILYTIHRAKGSDLRFVTGYKGFKRARRAFTDSELKFVEA